MANYTVAPVASNIQGQEEGSEDILRAMASIKKTSGENLHAIKKMEELISNTRSHSEQLHVEVERLKV